MPTIHTATIPNRAGTVFFDFLYFLIIVLSLFLILKINNGKAEIFYKVDINTNNILFKTKDIKKTSDNLIKNDIYFYFVKYNEEHSFI